MRGGPSRASQGADAVHSKQARMLARNAEEVQAAQSFQLGGGDLLAADVATHRVAVAVPRRAAHEVPRRARQSGEREGVVEQVGRQSDHLC